MMREFCLPGAQANREAFFFSTVYDPTKTITEAVHLFKQELVHCSRICDTNAARIRVLSRRLPRDVLLHASSLGDVPLTRFLEVVLRYDQQLHQFDSAGTSRTQIGGK